MTISMILLWIAVVFEFLLILGLVKRSEDARKDNEEIKKTIKEINAFLDTKWIRLIIEKLGNIADDLF